MDGPVLKVESDGYDNCALRTDGSVACWGSVTEWGYETGRYAMDAPDVDLLDFHFDASTIVACGIQRDLTLTCWGDLDHPIVQRVPEGTYRDVALILGRACAVATDGSVVCWGDDESYGIVEPDPGLTFVSIDGKHTHYCGITTESYVECWGSCIGEGCEDHP